MVITSNIFVILDLVNSQKTNNLITIACLG